MAVVLKTRPSSLRDKAYQAKVRRRFLFAGIGVLAVIGPMLGVSFLGDSGTASATVTGTASSSLVYTSGLPCAIFGGSAGTVTLAHGSTTTIGSPCSPGTTVTLTPYTAAQWSPAADSAGSVTTAGDIALIDASAATSNVIVTLFKTNLQNLSSDYSSFALPVNVYSCTSSCTTTGSWTAVANASSYITNDNGTYSISLASGSFYDLTIDLNGEYYCISTTVSSSAALAPTFFVTAQRA